MTTLDDNARGVNVMLCTECGEQREVPTGSEGDRAGWRMVETLVDIADEHVRVTINETPSGRIVYSARYTPDIARELARNLTLVAYELEDSE